MSGNIIEVSNLRVRYRGRRKYALDDLSFNVKRGEFLAITGPNGAGKTTLAYSLNGIVPHLVSADCDGSVVVEGLDTKEASVSELSLKIGLVFQNPKSQLSGAALTVFEEVAFGPQNMGLPKEEILKRTQEAIDIVGLNGLEDRSPFHLSGGQTQRLAIASVLAMRPSIIVLDEVTSQLDPVGTFEVIKTIYDLHKKHGLTILFISNKSELIAAIAERVLVINEGKLVYDDTPYNVYSNTEELKEIGLIPIPIAEFASLLKREASIEIDRTPITDDDGVALIKQLLGVENE